MKLMLVLHLCSIATLQCTSATYTGLMFSSHFDCAKMGYKMAYDTFVRLENDDYYGKDQINKEKLAIKFECKELDTKKSGTPS